MNNAIDKNQTERCLLLYIPQNEESAFVVSRVINL